ncbi:MAG: protein kinase [Deltaproteobacteria bacterium]|nr:protein kinase [Deltaproteobacteria bacterium]
MGDSGGIELAATIEGQAPGPLKAGDRAGEYEVTGQLGGGAMGEVYAGKHPVIGKRVAIKVIKDVLAKSEESAQRFIREAKAVNQIDHPHVIDVFAFGRLADGRLYLVMDLLEGSSLDEYLEAKGALSLDELLGIMEPLCSAVDAAHQAGIVHRDLKPANVFLGDGKGSGAHVYVLDFGVAKLMSSAQEEIGHTLTGQGAWIGTPVYMAPEQWTSEGANPQSDIYALGAMCYELLTGASPFKADSIPGVMQKHFHAEIPGVKETGKSVLRYIDDVLRQAMAKDPDDRFESAGQLFAALQGKRKAKAPTARPSKGMGLAPMAMGAALAVAAGGALYMFKTRTDDKPPETAAASAEQRADDNVLRIYSQPAGAVVVPKGREPGPTPYSLEGDPGQEFDITVKKPGYLSHNADCKIGDPPMTVELAAVTGFQGRWNTPSGLREFKREGDKVHALQPNPEGGEWKHYRIFEFVDVANGVAFEARAPAWHQAAPNEPSCRGLLAARYHFDPKTHVMTVSSESVKWKLHPGGKCTVESRGWTDPQPVTRLASTTDTTTVVSRAGASADAPLANNNGAPFANTDGAQTDGVKSPINPAPRTKRPNKRRQAKNKKSAKQRKLEQLKEQEAARRSKESRSNVGDVQVPAPQNAKQAATQQSKAPPQQETKAPAPPKQAPVKQRKKAPVKK